MATSELDSAAGQSISQSQSAYNVPSNGTAQEPHLAPKPPTEASQVADDPDSTLSKDKTTRSEPSDGRSHGEKRKDKGRNAYLRSNLDKRKRNDRFQERKRLRPNDEGVHGASQFTKEEIEAEGRRPKRKVAVLVGYAGTGYKGMQINGAEKTIEGDMFAAFVAAGAISKANADDPKKSSLSRCARTDKGVHAAGNVISLKLIIEDADVVDKINANLPPQIRVWAINRTNNSFNCYHSCDSRFYEYLMPSYTLLPPHPDSYLWKELVKAAEEMGKMDQMKSNLADVADFWSDVEEKDIKPFLAGLDPEVLAGVRARLDSGEGSSDQAGAEPKDEAVAPETSEPPKQPDTMAETVDEQPPSTDAPQSKAREPGAVDFALRDLRDLYIAAKRRYRVTPERLARLQDALGRYRGTHNFHNYTIHKGAKDPSARRHIKSFIVEPSPIVIGDTEWLSLKVHGQSFMMHQIRKMVAMATLLARCGTDLDRIEQSFGTTRIAVPKAPSLGLWLERPVFAAYNSKVEGNEERKAIDFEPFEKEIREFKDREIYSRIYKTEEEESTFYTFFQQVDSFKSNFFLWLTAKGLDAASIKAVKGDKTVEELDKQLGDEDEDPEGGEG